MAEEKKMKRCPVTLQPDIENILDWSSLEAGDFEQASQSEKEDFIQDRQSVSYWKDAWRRLKMNTVAMVALGVIIFLVLFAFAGPHLVPYGYEEFNKGAENLHPFHYALEDQKRLEAEIAARTQTETLSVDDIIAQAQAEAEAKGEKLSSVDIAKLRAQAKVNTQSASQEDVVDPDEKSSRRKSVPSYIWYRYVWQGYSGSGHVWSQSVHERRHLRCHPGFMHRRYLWSHIRLLRRQGRCSDAADCRSNLLRAGDAGSAFDRHGTETDSDRIRQYGKRAS